MSGSFVHPRRKRSACNASSSSSCLKSGSLKRQKVQGQLIESPLQQQTPVLDAAQDPPKPYRPDHDNLVNSISAQPHGALSMPSLEGFSAELAAVGELPPITEAQLTDIPSLSDFTKFSYCSSDTDIDDDEDECTSPSVDGAEANHGDDCLAGLLEDKKAVVYEEPSWPDMEVPFLGSKACVLAATSASVVPFSETAVPACTPVIMAPNMISVAATPPWSAKQLSTVQHLASSGFEVALQADGSYSLKPSSQPTPEAFVTQVPLGDTGLTHKEFIEGPSWMEIDSASSRASCAPALAPVELFPDVSTGALDADLLKLAGVVGDSTCADPGSDDSLFCILFGDDQPPPCYKLLPASQEVTDSELLPIFDASDSLLPEDRTFFLHNRSVTRMSSVAFAKAKPWELQVVADDLKSVILESNTSLNWIFVLPNRSPKELNRFLPEKTWTNGGKNKDRPSPLLEVMSVQHHGFGAHKLPREGVPGYLHLDDQDRAMLRFSMRIYTRRAVKSSKKGYPTAYVVLSLRKPIRRLRHAKKL